MSCLPYLMAVFACSVIVCDGKNLSLSEFLWVSTTGYRVEALMSVYVKGIAHSNLDPESFGAYNIQDSIYCYHATEGFEIAAGNATDPALKAFLMDRAASYRRYTKTLFETWQIKNASGIALNQAASDYINHEHNVAMTYDPVYYVVAIIPCTKLWPWIGQQIGVTNTSNFGVYTDWAWENFNPDDSGVAKYETVINEAYSQGNIDRNTALKIYSASMQGEANFFNSV